MRYVATCQVRIALSRTTFLACLLHLLCVCFNASLTTLAATVQALDLMQVELEATGEVPTSNLFNLELLGEL